VNYYEVLGVAPEATATEIKAAYRKKARQFHPDHNQDVDATAQFQTIQAAYEVLQDSEQRAAYDEKGYSDARESREMRVSAETILIQQVFAWVFNPANENPSADLIRDITKVLENNAASQAANLLEGTTVARQITRALAKLKHKHGARDFLRAALESRLEVTNDLQDRVRANMAATELAKRLIKEYDFECIRQIAGTSYGYSATFVTTLTSPFG
jgi:curved DNA-binding protein CbpA